MVADVADNAKSVGAAPERLMLVMVSVAVPVLESVKVLLCDWPTRVLSNVRELKSVRAG